MAGLFHAGATRYALPRHHHREPPTKRSGSLVWDHYNLPDKTRLDADPERSVTLGATQQGEKPVAGPALFCIQILGNPGNQYLGEGCVKLEIRSDQVAVPSNPNIVAEPGRVQDTAGINDREPSIPPKNNALPGVATKIRPTGSLEPYRQIANQRIPLTEFPTSPEGAPYQSEG